VEQEKKGDTGRRGTNALPQSVWDLSALRDEIEIEDEEEEKKRMCD